MQSGLIVKEQSGFFWVEVADGTVYRCRLRGRLLETAQSTDIAAIGDRVQITILEADEEGDKGTIESVEERVSVLSRAARTEGNRGGGEAQREHIIIANADRVFFVFAAAQPAPDLHLLDRLLVTGEKSDIDDLVIVVNKVDLEAPSAVTARFLPYERMGYRVVYTSAVQQIGVDTIRDLLKDSISVFTGPSGVGKSSLLNRIEPQLGRTVKAVSGYNEQGVHTTRESTLVKLAGGGYLADTPGMRYLSLWDVEPEELDAYFRDIAPYAGQCRFSDCSHDKETGCAVQAALRDGEISHGRYRSYQQLRLELEAQYATY